MPRETKDIGLFNQGVASYIDPRDIDDNAASEAVNIKPDIDGRLSGVQGTSEVVSNIKNATRVAPLKLQNSMHVLYDDGASMKYIRDFYGSHTDTPIAQTPAEDSWKDAAVVQNNQELHIGFGPHEDKKPKWFGHITHPRFGGPTPADLPSYRDAELKKPEGDIRYKKVVLDGDFIYGIADGHSTVDKINKNTGEVVATSEPYPIVRSFCDGGLNTLYVLAAQEDNDYIVQLNKLDMTNQKLPIRALGAFYTLPSGTYISDMIATTNKLWFAAHKEDAEQVIEDGSFLLNTDLPTGTFAPVADVTPRLKSLDSTGALVPGEWVVKVTYNDGLNDNVVHMRSIPPSLMTLPHVDGNNGVSRTWPLSLVKLSDTHIGWRFVGRKTETYQGHWMDISEGPTPVYHKATIETPVYYKGNNESGSSTELMYCVGEGVNPGDLVGAVGFSGLWHRDASGVLALYSTYPLRLYAMYGGLLARWSVSNLTPIAGEFVSVQGAGGNRWPLQSRNVGGGHLSSGNGEIVIARSSGKAAIVTVQPDLWLTDINIIYESLILSMGVEPVWGVSDHVFSDNTTYFYKVAFLYDGYQMSPLSKRSEPHYMPEGRTHSLRLTITMNQVVMPRRVTHLALYRAEATGKATEPTTLFRKVVAIPVSGTEEWKIVGDVVSTQYVDTHKEGPTYEAETGISETLNDTTIHYGLSAAINNHLFVADCWHPELKEEAKHYIFKSKAFRYNMFNWAEDLLRIPFQIVALAEYDGRLAVFGNNKIAIVNTDGLYIENIIHGHGARDKDSVLSTGTGVYVFGENKRFYRLRDAVLHYGSREATEPIEDIGYPVQNLLDGISGDIRLMYDGTHNSILVVSKGVGKEQILAFNTRNQGWFPLAVYSYPYGQTPIEVKDAFAGAKGDSYVIASVNAVKTLLKLFSQTTPSGFEWYWKSKVFTFGDESQTKKVYTLPVEMSVGVTVKYSVDGGPWLDLPANGKLPEGSRMCKTVQVSIMGSQAGSHVKSLSIIFRRMMGKR